ncbi:MAG: LysR family transcriptional regulator [Pararhodobacter sp.]|nr:LysR family transcriptional regulator [Pararhodobacter sp.]
MQRNRIELRHLRCFMAAVEAGSMTRAAEVLNIAQPAVSQHIRTLEEALGARLLDRSARGVLPTARGREVLEVCAEVFTALERLDTGTKARGALPDIRLGLPMTVGPLIAHPLLQAATDTPGAPRLQLSEGMSAHLAEWLLAERIDAAVLFHGQAMPELQTRPILSEPLYLVGPPGHFAPGDKVALSDLGRYPLILQEERNALHRLIRAAAEAQGVQLQARFVIDLVSETTRFVSAGEGFAVLAPIAFVDPLEAGLLSAAPIIAPEVMRGWVWATRRQRAVPAARRKALDAAQALTEATLRARTEAVLARLARLITPG